MLCTILGSAVLLGVLFILVVEAWNNRDTLTDYLLVAIPIALIVLFLCFFPPTAPYARHFFKSRIDKVSTMWSEFAAAAQSAAQEK